MSDATDEVQPIRVVGRPRVIGQIQTLYEVAPGDTVLFAEVSSATLQSVVVTGTAVAATAASADGRALLRPQAKAAAPADNQRKPAPTAPAPVAAPPSVQTSNGITTLSWLDPATGNTMKLSGRHTLVELLEIKRRIEQTRAAEAAKKKP
jgi:pyruvate-formate lyase